ncbi:MAG TPA: iron-containing alcohol dehydrogenase, partial [Leptolyngbyaceae cyanobacterium M33_DOE_097]|nr:iron-containing alcohol dehydrogenase [Leptolyngbyaceae cyanobacterium M33_DOE_097]
MTTNALSFLAVAPAQVIRGWGVITKAGDAIARLGTHPVIVSGKHTGAIVETVIRPMLAAQACQVAPVSYSPDCSEASLAKMRQAVAQHQADVIIGVGGGKALDAAKLLAHQTQLPVVTVPTSGATCAAWTALSNVYSQRGAFLYDVPLAHCPELLVLDYELVRSAPQRTLVAGIGDAIAKWYEASVSSGHSQQTLIIGAVQQARILRDILLQKSVEALQEPGGAAWQEVVDAT